MMLELGQERELWAFYMTGIRPRFACGRMWSTANARWYRLNIWPFTFILRLPCD